MGMDIRLFKDKTLLGRHIRQISYSTLTKAIWFGGALLGLASLGPQVTIPCEAGHHREAQKIVVAIGYQSVSEDSL